MRLLEEDIEHIKSIAFSIFGTEAVVYLFGSRVSKELRGGDIDLLVITNKKLNTLHNKLKFLSNVKLLIGDQKIDLIVRSDDQPHTKDLIFKEALAGVKL